MICVIAIPRFFSSNSSTADLRYPAESTTSESKNNRYSPSATLAPLFLPRAGKPPSITLVLDISAISFVLSVDPASAIIIS